ncbi:MAG TPA: hypothetical protein VFC78_21695 [Tepidisphaeraceae bacterium]|nr:hypothetical protein [Tepidisphaeraceae bacterium]
MALNVSASADDSLDLDADAVHAPSSARDKVILLAMPDQIVRRMRLGEAEKYIRAYSVELMPKAKGIAIMPQGLTKFRIGEGENRHGFGIKIVGTNATVPSATERNQAGYFDVQIDGRRYRVDFEAKINVRPDPRGGTGLDATDARVVWKGPYRLD